MHCLALQIDPKVLEMYMDDTISVKTIPQTLTRTTYKAKSHAAMDFDYEVNFMALLPPREVHHERFLPEMLPFTEMSKHKDYRPLLAHPIVLLFVAMKWYKLRYYFYIDLFVHLLFTIFLNVFMLTEERLFLHVFLYIFLIALFFWEVFQAACYGLAFFRYISHWLKMSLLALAAISLSIAELRDVYEIWIIQVYATTGFVSIINIFVICGNLPILSTNVIMVTTIYKTLFKAIFTYSMLILAFSTSMVILFKDNESKGFGDMGIAIFSIVLLLSGQFEIDAMELSSKMVVGYVLTVLFIFLMMVGLLNLLVGLAVSDIQEIQLHSRIYSQMLRITQVDRVEKVILKGNMIKYVPKLKQICLFSTRTPMPQVLLNLESKTIHREGKKVLKLYQYVADVWVQRKKKEDE